jgi:hypothetical protein
MKKDSLMPTKINRTQLRMLVEQVLSESDPESKLEINITKNEPDERAPSRNKAPKYSVDYVFKEDGIMFQFSGSLNPYHTGRGFEYEFEPSWFQDDESETFYNDNWEKIEDQILQKFYDEPR